MDQKSWKYPWTVWIFDFDHDPKTRSRNVIQLMYDICEATYWVKIIKVDNTENDKGNPSLFDGNFIIIIPKHVILWRTGLTLKNDGAGGRLEMDLTTLNVGGQSFIISMFVWPFSGSPQGSSSRQNDAKSSNLTLVIGLGVEQVTKGSVTFAIFNFLMAVVAALDKP